MSIRDKIISRIRENRLFRLRPIFEGDAEERTVLMSQEINEMVSGPWPNGPMGIRCGLLRADLESFVHGDRITVNWDPFKARDAKMGRLDPIADEVWDVRSQEPSPGLRVFCRFAEKDVLVALTCSPRSISVSWLDRLPLLGRDSRQWRDAIIECKHDWNTLFPAYEPLRGDSLDDYITNAILV